MGVATIVTAMPALRAGMLHRVPGDVVRTIKAAAGKGGAIRRVTGSIDARLYRVVPIAAPTEEERAQIEGRIAILEIEHHDLDDVIARLSEHPSQDQLQLRRFKKRKLVLKDSIARLKTMLVPDIPA